MVPCACRTRGIPSSPPRGGQQPRDTFPHQSSCLCPGPQMSVLTDSSLSSSAWHSHWQNVYLPTLAVLELPHGQLAVSFMGLWEQKGSSPLITDFSSKSLLLFLLRQTGEECPASPLPDTNIFMTLWGQQLSLGMGKSTRWLQCCATLRAPSGASLPPLHPQSCVKPSAESKSPLAA